MGGWVYNSLAIQLPVIWNTYILIQKVISEIGRDPTYRKAESLRIVQQLNMFSMAKIK